MAVVAPDYRESLIILHFLPLLSKNSVRITVLPYQLKGRCVVSLATNMRNMCNTSTKVIEYRDVKCLEVRLIKAFNIQM